MPGFLPTRFGIVLVREPTGECFICGVPTYSERDMRAHLASSEHREAAEENRLAEQARKARVPFMHDDPDPEVTEHLKGVGKKMLAEGRMVVKPNERAGFS